MIYKKNDVLSYFYENETVEVQAWGRNALRVRASGNRSFTGNHWALNPSDAAEGYVFVQVDSNANGKEYANMYHGKDQSFGCIMNGKIKGEINADGVLRFYNSEDKLLLQEHWRRLKDTPSMALNLKGRDYRSIAGENYKITARFCAADKEKIFGMGQYQQQYMDMKGCILELAQRNSQVSVPFYISNQGYGFLWNNPAVGSVVFGKNGTQWEANSARELDYLIIAGDTPAEIMENYMEITGKPPMMPEYGLGFWQCKLRYRTQEELMKVAGKYKALGLPLDVIIADFFHWTQQGEYKFDPECWPDVPGMCRELEDMGVKLMVSIWPTVDYRSENFKEMMEKGYLVQVENGVRVTMTCFGQEVFYDATNPEARAFVWDKVRHNYWDQGAKLYWLDVAEPEYSTYSFHNYRYYLGNVEEVGNIYPKLYTKGFYDGMTREGDTMPVNLVRSAWAGSAKYGALVWSGDIDSTFECFRRQVKAGLSMAMAGIPWWTTDIGGFHGGDMEDPRFRELLLRWFAYACFCPVFRLHGNRIPSHGFEGDMISGIGQFGSGADNEVWSYGEKAFTVMKAYMLLRERMRPYLRNLMQEAHEKGTPVIRPLFYVYPDDPFAWESEDSFMLGADILAAPVMKEGQRVREVYLPEGSSFRDAWDGAVYEGGQMISVNTPVWKMPVFIRHESELELDFFNILED